MPSSPLVEDQTAARNFFKFNRMTQAPFKLSADHKKVTAAVWSLTNGEDYSN
jgi:hypothetical protein